MKAIENGMDMNIFDYMRSSDMEKEAPLAARMRPRTLEEVVGQEHIIGRDKLLYRAIKADKISSVIFYGPPGTGKTTLAKVIASTTSAEFTQINATVAGKKDMEEVVAKAKEIQGMYGKRTILFIDEIHRFNKAQQDYLLPFVEDGTVILIGATTENPYFEVNGALLSRSIIFELKPIPVEAVRELLRKAVCDTDRGMGAYGAVIDEDALDFLADISGGDARHALNAIELGIMSTGRSEDGKIHITLDVAQECIQKRAARYDKSGDNHYDTISAFIKSMRGSDPDAACPDALCGRKCCLCGQTHHDLRRGRRGKCGSPGIGGGHQCLSGRRAHRHAGGPDHFSPGCGLCGQRSEEQRCMQRYFCGHGRGRAHRKPAHSRSSAGCPLQGGCKAGPGYRI